MSTVSSQQCPRCQFPLEQGASICPQCGLDLAENPAPSEPLPTPSQPLPGSVEGAPVPGEVFTSPEAATSPAGWSVPGQPPYSGMFPTPTPSQPPVPVKPRRGRKITWIALALALVVILGAGGSLAYALTRPKPVIQVKSDYHMGSTLVGSAGTSFRITGQQFSGNASILFLLDGQPAPGARTALSDGNGSFQVDLTVTPDWKVGSHMLTARDDKGYLTKAAIPIEIVEQGVAGTPGPNGAPADNASFSLSVTVTVNVSGGQSYTFQQLLTIVGNPDPAGGKVCSSDDNGQPHVYSGTLDNSSDTFTETITLTCTGTYKQGHLTYTETATSDVIVVNNSLRCATSGPYVYGALDGSFSSATSISGKYHRDYVQANCPNGSYIYRNSETGTWEATL